jgi:hypothetical protein
MKGKITKNLRELPRTNKPNNIILKTKKQKFSMKCQITKTLRELP